MRGKLIVIEGGDGVGKSSLGLALAERIEADLIEFPNNETVTGPLIRSYLRREWSIGLKVPPWDDTPRSALAFQALQIANKMELMPEINTQLAYGSDVVCVRYWQSAWVYGQLDGLDPAWLIEVHRHLTQPDCAILLDLPPDVAMARRAERDGAQKSPDRYEGDLERADIIRRLYNDLWRQRQLVNHWIIDAQLSPETVLEAAIKAVRS